MPSVNLSAFFFVIFLFFGCTVGKAEKKKPTSVKGVLDLQSEGNVWDLKKDGILNLEGEWEFYWRHFLVPCRSECEVRKDQKTDYIQVPSLWNEHQINGEKIGWKGSASYRLRIKNLQSGRKGLFISGIFTNYRLYVNGELLHSSGTVGETEETSVFDMKPASVHLPENASELDLIFHVSNYMHRIGGIRDRLRIGEYSALEEDRRRNVESDFFLFGSLIIMSVYHLGIYFLRRNDRSALYFAVICFLFGMRPLFLGEREGGSLLKIGYGSILLRIEYFLLYMKLPFIVLYFREIFPAEFKSRFFSGLGFFSGLISICPLFCSVYLFTNTLFLFHIAAILTSVAGLYLIVLAVFRKREGAVIFAFGISVLTAATVNDVMVVRDLIHTGFYVSHGLFIFLFSQAYLLSARFSKAYSDSEMSRKIAEEQRQLAERRQMEIEKLNRTKDEFLSNLSHELKTPLTYIYMYSEMLCSPNEQETVLEYGKELLGNARKLNDYVEDLILMTDIESGIELNCERVIIGSVLETELQKLQPLAAEKNIAIQNNADEKAVFSCDRNLVSKAVYAVLKNAVLYNKENGSVLIETRMEEDYFILSVQDAGIGIAEEHQEKIFDKFFRIDSALTYEASGVGIGLYIAKKIIELHRGRLEVRSESGAGTTFTIFIPIINEII